MLEVATSLKAAMRTVVFACLPVFISGRQICAGTVAFSSLMPIAAVMLMVLLLRRAKS